MVDVQIITANEARFKSKESLAPYKTRVEKIIDRQNEAINYACSLGKRHSPWLAKEEYSGMFHPLIKSHYEEQGFYIVQISNQWFITW